MCFFLSNVCVDMFFSVLVGESLGIFGLSEILTQRVGENGIVTLPFD